MNKTSYQEQVKTPDYPFRTPRHYLEKMEPLILESFTATQLQAITAILKEAIPKPSPKIVDLRFIVDLVLTRFYVVLLVGKDRRKKQRRYVPQGVAKIGNVIAVIVLLIGVNLLISASILLFAYLFKSFIGIDFFKGDVHFSDKIKEFFQ